MTAAYPVLEVLPELRRSLEQCPVTILQAPPGAGKSTVLPLHLLNEPWLKCRRIIMLEPRRLAARSVASRLAALHGDALGNTVGFRIRFETQSGPLTRLEVVTDGILTRMLQQQDALGDIGLIIFDEFHERSLHADTGLVLAQQVQEYLHDDMRILIMSATLESSRLSSVLGNAPVITSTGRQFPVQITYEEKDLQLPIHTGVARAIHRALREQEGDILVFLPGAGEIERTIGLLEEEATAARLVPLYGDLPFERQQQAILPDTNGRRKVVLATTIAETSLTIEGITTVIDAGLTRVPRYDPRSGLTSLETVRVTADAADQRAGRAGRLGPGFCYRLWTQATQRHLQPSRAPEITGADLTSAVLELRQWGIKRILDDLRWPDPPSAGAVRQAEELLEKLEAIDSNGITQRGRAMLRLPTHPRIAHMLLVAEAEQLQPLAADVAALLEEKDPLRQGAGADLSLRVEVLHQWRKGGSVAASRSLMERIERLANHWRRLLKTTIDQTPVIPEQVGQLLSCAYPERLARQTERHSERFKLSNGRMGRLPDHDPLIHYPWIVAAQVDARDGDAKIFLAAPIHESDVLKHATPHQVVRWDEQRQAVVAIRELRFGDMVVNTSFAGTPDPEESVAVICAMTRSLGLTFLGWSDAQRAWQARVMSLKGWNPLETWPDVSDEHLLATIENWLPPFLQQITKRSDFGKLDWSAICTHIIGWDRERELEELAPARITVPSGSAIQVQYSAHGDLPVMQVRLQEVFGWLETPTINKGRTRLVLHLLSPGYKPVQVTQDMQSFWKNTYDEVRSELRRRYPRHSWPDNPLTAQAIRGAVRRKS
ncbi:MAG: ATP-dependent helicase HrpB [Cyclobacteriaceae bacterium]|nr:ATP-dependent helicase HrpB [Cyclobacteriaceae bacterium]